MIKIFFKAENLLFQNRVDYVLRFIERHPLVQGRMAFAKDEKSEYETKLYYGIESEDVFYIPAQKIVFSKVLPDFDLLVANQYNYELIQLYALAQESKPPSDFITNNRFQFDVLETLFFHISRFEEWHYQEGREDEYGRMDARQQFLVKYQLHQIPVVDHLILAFAKAMGLDLKPVPTKIKMTHDIDEIRKNNGFLGKMRTTAAALLKMRDVQRAVRVLKDNSENPFDSFDYLLLENDRFEKTIYFLVGGESRYDTPYDLEDQVVQKSIRLAHQRGYQIGIHPSYDTLDDQALMAQELKKLEAIIEKPIHISRQHYLRFSFKHTPAILEELGIHEDSSIGFADRIGFRCGTGFPYHLYDFKNERAFRFVEIPLVFMESALLDESNFDAEKFEKIWADFLSNNETDTMITFNFHNSRFYDAALSGIDMKQLYLDQFQ